MPNPSHRRRQNRRCQTLYLLPDHRIFGVIPEEFRKAMGNRIYGCDDCQLVCPWNREAELTEQSDFHRRDSLRQADLVMNLFLWDEATFLKRWKVRRSVAYQSLVAENPLPWGTPLFLKHCDQRIAKQGQNELLDEHIIGL